MILRMPLSKITCGSEKPAAGLGQLQNYHQEEHEVIGLYLKKKCKAGHFSSDKEILS